MNAQGKNAVHHAVQTKTVDEFAAQMWGIQIEDVQKYAEQLGAELDRQDRLKRIAYWTGVALGAVLWSAISYFFIL